MRTIRHSSSSIHTRHVLTALLGGAIAIAGCASSSPEDAAVTTEDPGSSSLFIDPVPNDDTVPSPPVCAYTGSPPAAVGERRDVLRVLTHNAFGVTDDSRAECALRGRSLGSAIARANPAYDIVSLQEHWNTHDFGAFDCDASSLTNAIWSTGRYKNSNNNYRHFPTGEVYQGETDGSLSLFTLHPVEAFEAFEWKDIPRDYKTVKVLHGFTFARIHINNTDQRVDVYNAHLLAEDADGCTASCRRKELDAMREVIRTHSAHSGNPVLVMGDFNTGGPPTCNGNKNYGDIMQALGNPRDLWLENHPADPGFTSDCIDNGLLGRLEGCRYRDRIDFMFVITAPDLTNSKKQVVVRNPEDMKLVKFMRSDLGSYVSDHFGLEATLEIRDKGNTHIPLRGLGGKCMMVDGGRTTPGTSVVLYDCQALDAQHWTIGHDGRVRGRGGNCLTIRGGSAINRAAMEMRTCDGGDEQRFDFTAAGTLRSRLDASKCVEVAGGEIANGTPIQVYSCNGTASQVWTN
jgi:endonuclease/exonuclease/phosphatase family metal-dependent hydrolase